MPLTNFETSMVRPNRSLVTQTSNRDSPGRSSVDQAHILHAGSDAYQVHSVSRSGNVGMSVAFSVGRCRDSAPAISVSPT